MKGRNISRIIKSRRSPGFLHRMDSGRRRKLRKTDFIAGPLIARRIWISRNAESGDWIRSPAGVTWGLVSQARGPMEQNHGGRRWVCRASSVLEQCRRSTQVQATAELRLIHHKGPTATSDES